MDEKTSQEVIQISPPTENLPIRIEENWSDATESLAKEWLESATKASDGHNKSGKSNKFKNAITGLPSILIPAIFAPVSIAVDGNENAQYISMVGFIASGIFSGVNTFFAYDRKYQKHMDFSAKYADVVSDIRYELSKSRKFRTQPDQFLMKIQMKLDNLGAQAPDL